MPSLAADPRLQPDRKNEIVAASVTLLVLPTVAVFLRCLSRWMSRAGFWWDDYIIVLSMILGWGLNIINLQAIRHGFGNHDAVLPTDTVIIWFKYLYVSEFIYALAVSCFKYSILLFLYRIFPIAQFRRILLGATIWVTALTLSCITASILQCIPIHEFWDTLAGRYSLRPGGHCINLEVYFKVSGALETVTNFVLLAMPIPLVWRLRTRTTQKLVLTAIFTAGLTVCAVSIVRITRLTGPQDPDVTWNYVSPLIWTAAEPSIAVIGACLPSLRPLFVRVVLGGSYKRQAKSQSSRRSLTSWQSSKGKGSTDHSFNPLQEAQQPVWTQNRAIYGAETGNHNVAVHGGREIDSEEYEMGGAEPAKTSTKSIMVQTTVTQTISDRLDWHDELF